MQIRFGSLSVPLFAAMVLALTSAAHALTPSTTSVTVSSPNLVYGSGATETLKVTVTGTNAKGHPGGTVTVTGNKGLGTLATISVNGGCTSIDSYTYKCTGTATIPASTAPATYTLTAAYGGNATYSGSSGTATVSISAATPTAALGAVTSTYGGTAVFTATDTGVSGGAAPSGAATFVINGLTPAATPSCSSSGDVRTCTLTYVLPPSIGASATGYITSVSFAADSKYSTSTASSTLTVNQAVATATIASATQFYAKNVTISETNTGVGAGYAAPTGAPKVKVGTQTQTRAKPCTVSSDVNTCAALYSIRNSQTAGPYTETVTFAADSNYLSSTASATLTVEDDLSSTTVTATPANLNPSGTTTLTATVKNTSHNPTAPTGTVTFTAGATNLGTCTLASKTCTKVISGSALPAGRSDTVTATYGGLTNEIAGSSGTTLVTLPADIVFSSVTHYMGTVPLGSNATYGVKLSNNDATAFPFALTLSGPASYTFGAASCGTSVPANSSCEIVFTYTPTAVGHETATWSVASDGLVFSPSDGGTLTADAVEAAGVTLSTAGHNFLDQSVGTTSDVYGTVLSNGTAVATSLTFSQTDATDFPTYENNCPAVLPAYATCNLEFYFAPQTTGVLQNLVTITATQGGNPVTITSGGTAVTGVKLVGTGD